MMVVMVVIYLTGIASLFISIFEIVERNFGVFIRGVGLLVKIEFQTRLVIPKLHGIPRPGIPPGHRIP